FLDNVVTSTLVFEGAGDVVEYVGGYADWLRQRPVSSATTESEAAGKKSASRSAAAAVQAPPFDQGPSRRKLTYNQQRELNDLPSRIEALEAEHVRLEARAASPDFYKEGTGAIAQTLDRITEVEAQLLEAYERLDALKERA